MRHFLTLLVILILAANAVVLFSTSGQEGDPPNTQGWWKYPGYCDCPQVTMVCGCIPPQK